MSKYDTIPTLTSNLATDILNKTLEELQTTENVQKLEEAKNDVGNEMLKMMQYLFPIVVQIEMNVLKEFGYPEGRESIIKFSQALRGLEYEDPEISRLHGLVKAYYLPSLSVHTANEYQVDERTNNT